MRKTLVIAATSAIAGLALIGGTAYGITANTPAPTPEPTKVSSVIEKVGDETPSSVLTPTPTVAVVVVEPAPAPVDPSKCPSGTVAGAVDEAGNESACYETNNGQQCVAYDDNNNCTQYYKP